MKIGFLNKFNREIKFYEISLLKSKREIFECFKNSLIFYIQFFFNDIHYAHLLAHLLCSKSDKITARNNFLFINYNSYFSKIIGKMFFKPMAHLGKGIVKLSLLKYIFISMALHHPRHLSINHISFSTHQYASYVQISYHQISVDGPFVFV